MSFSRYKSYKNTGLAWLGEAPEHWLVIAPKRVLRSSTGGTLIKGECAAEPDDGLFPAFSASGQDVWIESADYTAPGIVLSAVGARCGKTFKADGEWGVVANTHCLFPMDGQSRDFFWYLTNREDWWEKGGTAQPFVKVKETLDRAWCLPPTDEQTAIATFLDRETAKIDALIAEQQRLIELLQEKRQAVISHAVTKGLDPDAPMKDSGVEWLGEVPEHWRITRVKHLCERIEQGWSPQCENESSDGDVPAILKVGCVNGGIFRPSENKRLPSDLDPIPQYSVRRGDLLVSRANTKELVGSAAVAGEDYPWLYICDKLYRITIEPGKSTSNYLALYLGSNEARGQLELGASGASHSMQNISQSVLMEMPIPLPEPDEQERIVNAVSVQCSLLDRLRANAIEAIGLFQERRSALITAAVTGQIDVRGLAPEAHAA